ncbi:MAG: HAMP domain-containing histidine kinase [Chloroflexi bacterium]|nr:HAMP domain-containing histidine kinase [Chloroflexota bacterium]
MAGKASARPRPAPSTTAGTSAATSGTAASVAGSTATAGTSAAASVPQTPRPFPLVRYYTLASVVVIAVALVAVILVTSQSERRSVISRLEHESDGEARLVAFDLVERLSLQATAGGGLSTAFAANSDNAQRAILNSIRGRPIIRVDVLDQGGAIVYSTDRNARESTLADESSELMAAIDAGSVSRYGVDREITLTNGAKDRFDIVESLIPVFPESAAGEGPVKPYAILAIYHDVTESVSNATAGVERIRIMSVVGTMAALFLALLGVVIQGERAIRRSSQRLAAALDQERELRGRLDDQNHELTEANEAKIKFLSAVSHELKTPLTGIVAFTDLLRLNRDANLTARQMEQLTIIERNGRRLDSLVNDLLDLSRIERGTFELSPTRWEIAPFLAEVAGSVGAIYAGKRQQLVCEPFEQPLWVVADRDRIGQVMINLLSNASKYSLADTQVTVSARFESERTCIAVSDQGFGIAKEDQASLFTEFYRINTPATRDIPGSGLGLAIVKSIVERHGGGISVESATGKGSTFSFWLPQA